MAKIFIVGIVISGLAPCICGEPVLLEGDSFGSAQWVAYQFHQKPWSLIFVHGLFQVV